MPVELEGVFHTYAPGTRHATPTVRGVNLSVQDGDFVAIMGRTGSGKSTLIQLMAGLVTPVSGRVLVDGQDINQKTYDRKQLRRRMGVAFQHPEHQLFEATVERDVAFGLKHTGMSGDEVMQNVRWALETMGFDFQSIRSQPPMGLSGGEKRRVAIAGILAVRPGILILDEPIAGLDPLGREAFLKVLRGLNDQGVTIMMVSHDADAVCDYANRVVLMDGGCILKDGSVGETFRDEAFLTEHGIGLSQAAKIAKLLREKGLEVSEGIVTSAGLLQQLLAMGKVGI